MSNMLKRHEQDARASRGFFIDIYTLNSYSTGTIDFSLTPKRVQQ